MSEGEQRGKRCRRRKGEDVPAEEQEPEQPQDPTKRRRGRPKGTEPTRAICFRCAPHVLRDLDSLCERLGRSRTSLIVAAAKMLCEEVRSRGGYLLPRYERKIDFTAKNIGFVDDEENPEGAELTEKPKS